MPVTKKDFPKTLYVFVDEDGAEKYLIANKNYTDCAVLEEEVKIGVYELKEIAKVSAWATLVTDK